MLPRHSPALDACTRRQQQRDRTIRQVRYVASPVRPPHSGWRPLTLAGRIANLGGCLDDVRYTTYLTVDSDEPEDKLAHQIKNAGAGCFAEGLITQAVPAQNHIEVNGKPFQIAGARRCRHAGRGTD